MKKVELVADLVHRSMAFELAVAQGLLTREQVLELGSEVRVLVKSVGVAQAWAIIAAMEKNLPCKKEADDV